MLFITFLNSLKETTCIEVVDDVAGEVYRGSVCELWEDLACAQLLNGSLLEVNTRNGILRVRVF